MTNGNGNDGGDWGYPDPNQRPTQQPDPVAPQHRPPQDQYPQPHGGMPPSKPGGDLETSDFIAMVVSFFLPGIGQLMLGQTVKGLVIFGIAVFTGCGMGLISIAAVVDAFLVATAQKRRIVGEWEFFPDFQETVNKK